MCSTTSTASCWMMRRLVRCVRLDLLQQAAHAGGVHFDAQVVVLGVRLRDRGGGLAHAEADLEDRRGAAPEGRREIERAGA